MSIFVPNKVYLRGILLHYFIQKKSAAEAHRILVQTYGDNALSDTTCRDWFRRFKNNDFQLEDKERSQTLSELGEILQVDESSVSKRLKGLGMIQKQGHWVSYELKPRDVERRFGTKRWNNKRNRRKKARKREGQEGKTWAKAKPGKRQEEKRDTTNQSKAHLVRATDSPRSRPCNPSNSHVRPARHSSQANPAKITVLNRDCE
ncbi:MOS1T transposase, partial [Pseudoatta argentina]